MSQSIFLLSLCYLLVKLALTDAGVPMKGMLPSDVLDNIKAENAIQWMVDHSDVQEVVVADNLKKQQISDFIHDKHFIVKDDLHVLHSGRQVRRRRSSPEAFSGPHDFHPITAHLIRQSTNEIDEIIDLNAGEIIDAVKDDERKKTLVSLLKLYKYTVHQMKKNLNTFEKKEFHNGRKAKVMSEIEASDLPIVPLHWQR